ncbi:hypothetical protein BT63DRAFT_429280 [Microthyrium microscopicum]|uniref:F-box domain-containing protein n=1 Tax=Microthyrium microscopicum TaxID=703497 RepID=A0A6A6TYL9_9PEZI|nr:hypothetical protein BT63DRAFT_429280 [Microthyrium microscopicum]
MTVKLEFPSPLTFDRVMETRSVVAHNSLLFKIPFEILSIIAENLYATASKKDLANLALVNSDCRQLARACQFRSVKLDASSNSEKLLGLLRREVIERRHNQGHTRNPSLGVCMRHLKGNIQSFGEAIRNAIPRKPGRSVEDAWVSDDDAFDSDEEEAERWEDLSELMKAKAENHRSNVLFVASHLPHLETFEMDVADWNTALFNHIISSPSIKNLTFRMLKVQECAPTAVYGAIAWPLETLDISLDCEESFDFFSEGPPVNISENYSTILKPCSTSLRSLKLSHQDIANGKRSQDPISFSLKFPSLQYLDINEETGFDQSALRSLVLSSSSLSTLAINYANKTTRKLLDHHGQIPSLETLVLHMYKDPGERVALEFLKQNKQLKSFAIDGARTVSLIERTLSLLTTFSNLSKLSLAWKGDKIPDSSLIAISKLSSLEVIHLTAGRQQGLKLDWLVDHEPIRHHLGVLRNLKRIAFTRDIYSYPYKGRYVPYSDYLTLQKQNETSHFKFMHSCAYKYVQEWPFLQFLHIGLISVHIHRGERQTRFEQDLDVHFSWMRDMFGIDRDSTVWR